MGTFDKPIIDTTNTSASIEVLPLLKNPRYDKSSTLPIIYVEVFHSQDKISYSTSEPYNGPGNYILEVAFKDGKKIPTSTNESMTVLVGAFDQSGTMILKEYINVRWPANS
ncbi:MAG: hypothetical protein Q7J10_07825 [Methanosarcinaceae archaeon]|nr:hypothetical protein [Methanosarcinaceae archaeon]